MTQTQQHNVPALRFPEFSGEWEEKTLGDISAFSSGGTPSKSIPSYWNGSIPWISAASMHDDIIEESEHYVTEEGAKNGTRVALQNTVLLLVRGSMLFKRIPAGICARTVTFNQDVKALSVKGDNSSRFLLSFIRSQEHRLLSLVTGTGIGAGKLDTDELKSLPFARPTLPEQQKIASFLSQVDRKIAQLGEKKALLQAYKKGMMQKLFSQELRFKDPQGHDFPDWEEKRLGEVFDRITRKNKNNNTNVLTISAQMGLVNQMNYFNHSVAAKDLTGYYLLEKGDFAYNKSYSKGYPMGAIKRLKAYDSGVVSTLYICFKSKNPEMQPFFEKLFDSGYQNRWIHKIAQEGARNHGLLNMAVGDFFEIPLPFPSPPEQQKIADFLSSIDRKIDLVATELDHAKTFKKGLLQQMFI